MEVDYADKLILAPMVRVGTLPFRLLSYECGADLTYSEELVALKLMKCTRVVNEKTKTIDFVTTDKNIAYQAKMGDEHKNIAQLGAADAASALAAANVIVKDIGGIDLNCGCPKHFSVHGGMGAALLKTPDTICDIVKTLNNNVDKPITIKIRLLEQDSDTVEIIRRAEQMGASAVAIHSRYVHERPRERAHWDKLAEVIEMAGASVSVPLIANGDVHGPDDVLRVKELKGISSVMIARGAINDPSIFGKAKALMEKKQKDEEEENMEPIKIYNSRSDAVKRYLHWALRTNNNLPNTKYVLKTMIEVPGGLSRSTLPTDHILWTNVNESKSYADLCKTWNVDMPSAESKPEVKEIKEVDPDPER